MVTGSVEFYKRLIRLALFMFLPLFFLSTLFLGSLVFRLNTAHAQETRVQSHRILVLERQLELLRKAVGLKANDYSAIALESGLENEALQKDKVAYLTFDDGPSERTLEILEILDREQVKATFFVVNNPYTRAGEVLQRISAGGHTVGMHSASHDYRKIYESSEAFMADIWGNYQFIVEHTGVSPEIFRFPGGSMNRYNSRISGILIEEMEMLGFSCFDWNVDVGDASGKKSGKDEIIENVRAALSGQRRLIVLAHDGRDKAATVEALPELIRLLRDRGYRFALLDRTVEPLTFRRTDN